MKKVLHLLIVLLLMVACDEPIFMGGNNLVVTPTKPTEPTAWHGFYLLNEGNMGSNKATLDYFDFATGTYTLNIYTQVNPHVPMELGDVGNDLKRYGGRIYAVLNASNKVEVMDITTAQRIGQVNIANCRYVAFDGAYAYVSSYAGPIQLYPQYEQRGYVLKVDTLTLQVVDTCLVGFQPEELVVLDNKIYVANSGGYLSPNYENTLSVIDMDSFEEIERIEVDINLHRVRLDEYGKLWVASRGNYLENKSRLFCVDPEQKQVVDILDVACSNLCIVGDSLFYCANDFDALTMKEYAHCGIVNINTRKLVTENLLNDSIHLIKPYGIMVDPLSRDIYLTDARNCVTPGVLYCFNPEGQLKWKTRTGDIPAHFVLW